MIARGCSSRKLTNLLCVLLVICRLRLGPWGGGGVPFYLKHEGLMVCSMEDVGVYLENVCRACLSWWGVSKCWINTLALPEFRSFLCCLPLVVECLRSFVKVLLIKRLIIRICVLGLACLFHPPRLTLPWFLIRWVFCGRWRMLGSRGLGIGTSPSLHLYVPRFLVCSCLSAHLMFGGM